MCKTSSKGQSEPQLRVYAMNSSRKTMIFASLLVLYTLVLLQFQVTTDLGCQQRGRQLAPVTEDIVETRASMTSSKRCAPWIQDRKVLFLDIATMADYHNPDQPYKGGESYVTASMDWALRELGFQVHQQSLRRAFRNPEKFMNGYHRIFMNSVPTTLPHEVRCRLRPLIFWPGNREPYPGLVKKQILTAYADEFNTFGGYFIHHTVVVEQQQNHSSQLERPKLVLPKEGRHALLLGKVPSQLDPTIIAALLQGGFALHATCNDCVDLPEKVTNHKKLSPQDFADLVEQCLFVVGMGNPKLSPTPLLALSKGTAFLNRVDTDGRNTQHNAMARLGAPYSHLYRNATDVVEAANQATRRFQPYIPPEYRPDAMMARMCSILEDEAPCTHPNETDAVMEVRAYSGIKE